MKWRIIEEQDTYPMYGTYSWFYPEKRILGLFWRRIKRYDLFICFGSYLEAWQWIENQQPVVFGRKRVIHTL